MKRLNPSNGEIFKYGDLREDGYRFIRYISKRIREDGFLQEQWASPEAYRKLLRTALKIQARSRATALGRAKFLVKSAKEREKAKGNKVTLSVEEITKKIENGYCELTGLPFDLLPSTTHHHNPYAPSLDRIDSSNREYSPQNTRVVLTSVNAALGQYGEQVMLPILEAMVDKIKEKHEN